MLAADLNVFGELDRRQIADELERATPFAAKLRTMLAMPDARERVTASALRAVEDEMRPGSYPTEKGAWPVLRKRVGVLVKEVPKIVEREVARMPFEKKMQVVRAIAAGYEPSVSIGVQGFGELGQFDFISSIVTSIAGAASNVYSSKVTADAQKDIAKMQAASAMKSLETQMAIANAQQAINEAKVAVAQAEVQKAAIAAGGAAPSSILTQDIGAGIPLWTLPVAATGLGFVLYFILRKKKATKR